MIIKCIFSLAAIVLACHSPAAVVRSMLGARGAIMSARAWKNPYITDGLVAMWDGEWNAGGGVHDPNERSVWVDIVGGHNMAIKGAVPDSVFTENAFHNDNLKFGTICKDKITYGAIAITVETSAFLSEDDRDALLLQNRSGSYHYHGFTFFRYGSSMIFPDYWVNYQQPSPRPTAFLSAGSSHSLAFVLSIDEIRIFKDGVYVGGTTGDFTGLIEDINNIGCWKFSASGWGDVDVMTGSNWTGDIYGARVYSKALTDAEIAANYVVDKARFNLP
jgi:hypothetical protein